MLFRVLALAPLFVAATAHAQAPGEWAQGPSNVAPQPAQAEPYAPPCAVANESVMANRWSIGAAIGSLRIAPKDNPDASTDFGVGELALRFRATLHFELELSAMGGSQRLQDGSQGKLEARSAMLAARYRFNPEGRWNWFVMAGLGGTSVTRSSATDQQRSDATRPSGELGIGIERRFHHIAISAELRGLSIAAPDTMDVATPVTGGTGTVQPTATTTSLEQQGGSFSLGLSYYF